VIRSGELRCILDHRRRSIVFHGLAALREGKKLALSIYRQVQRLLRLLKRGQTFSWSSFSFARKIYLKIPCRRLLKDPARQRSDGFKLLGLEVSCSSRFVH
jgi:hypothetical protein